MTRLAQWIWSRGIVSTFLAGVFTLLPIAITVGILSWVIGHLKALLGPGSMVGDALQSVGFRFATNPFTASVIGFFLVLVGIWLLGLLVRSKTRHRFDELFGFLVDRIPVVKSIYRTATQLVGMLKKDEQDELKAMRVVFCSFGKTHGAGLLGLLATPEIYRFEQRDYHFVYLPTSPIPMSGGILLVPVEVVRPIEMSAEQLMRIYFSMGILSPQVVPPEHHVVNDAGRNA